ncbi:hypothetical protein FBY39_2528 [Microbacterium sp. SLBN-146]|nr:hypothetical protein FBY39_2528 [Microbacterium sp. SLBN-146]
MLLRGRLPWRETAVPPRVPLRATLTAAVTGLPRSVLMGAEALFFRKLPGDGRLSAAADDHTAAQSYRAVPLAVRPRSQAA